MLCNFRADFASTYNTAACAHVCAAEWQQQAARVKISDACGPARYTGIEGGVRSRLASAFAEEHNLNSAQGHHEIQKQTLVFDVVKVKLQFLPGVFF